MSTESEAAYDFDEDFQQQLVTLMLKDAEFNNRTEGLVKPQYFTDRSNAIIAHIAQEYYTRFRFCPSPKLYGTLIREAEAKKLIRKDELADLVARIKEVAAANCDDADFISDNVANFARRRAMEEAIFAAVDLLEKGTYDKVEGLIKEAMSVGVNEDTNRYDYWGGIDSRTEYRSEVAAGRIKKTGITTGHQAIDALLRHGGWGRKELSCLLGGAKAGKSMALLGFALAASLANFKVCYVTLEVAADIIAERIDANVSDVEMASMQSAIGVIKAKVQAKSNPDFTLDIYEYPSGSMTPSDLRRLVARKRSQGIQYDLVVVDYADIMRPNVYSSEPRENSRTIYLDLRAVAQEFNLAMLTATQSNREGLKATVGKMEHVSEDINKVRTVDLMLSLNASDDEKARGQARIYFTASRNQKSDITVVVKSEIGKAKYISSILGIES